MHLKSARAAPITDRSLLCERARDIMVILQTVRRATAVDATTIHMGMDADAEKRRFGSRVQQSGVHAQARDHHNAAVLRQIVAEVGVDSCARSRALAS
jgi:hypothetical protein